MGLSTGFAQLQGTQVATATVDIETADALVTLKCTACGAQVMINTTMSLQARCHWCRHTLSLNNRIPNGAVPDAILPFSVSKQQASDAIASFARGFKHFQHRAFRKGFKPENVMGVYLPYMTVDANVAVRLDGVGQCTNTVLDPATKQMTRVADEYHVTRFMDLHVDDLLVETSSRRLHKHVPAHTNNILSALLDFDVKKMVRFDANYLGDQFTAERRDMDVKEAESFAARHYFTLARTAVQSSVKRYDLGVQWTAEQLDVKGSRWTAVLLPLWLYSFEEQIHGKTLTHYIAVNGRTGKALGSIPVDQGKLAWASVAVSLAGSALMLPIVLATGSWDINFATGEGHYEGNLASLAGMGLMLLGPLAGVWLWSHVNRRYRNPTAEYVPQRVVAHAVVDSKEQDYYSQPNSNYFDWGARRNDLLPSLPLQYSKAIKR
jgi:hypothetical protein